MSNAPFHQAEMKTLAPGLPSLQYLFTKQKADRKQLKVLQYLRDEGGNSIRTGQFLDPHRRVAGKKRKTFPVNSPVAQETKVFRDHASNALVRVLSSQLLNRQRGEDRDRR
ncbi:hypothetical protein CDAR_96651 [Caerostris darwini]|uniref:Uncharacterized protein n=1 Tax=Caerostris darwini TaxID=1538125 RepID=A0AAV4QSL4_9ARAC|nr:hypothetical protein CDAR_96651 [Caerostris darwini]